MNKTQEEIIKLNQDNESNGAYKTQKEWIAHYKDNKTIMMSAPDIYRALNDKALDSLRKDLKGWVISGTKVIYNQKDLETTIKHYVGSKKEITIKVKEVRDLSGDDFNEEDLPFLQALFNTKDNFKKITETLDKIGESRKLRIYTPTQSSRKEDTERSVVFDFYVGRFDVVAGSRSDLNIGCSRRVLLDSEPKARSNEKKCPHCKGTGMVKRK